MNKVVTSVVFVVIFLILIILNETSGASFLMDNMMIVGVSALVAGMVLSWLISKLVDKKKEDEEE